ncbi:uncharacterized protein LOC124110294 [Haliotis rufescens]|uniref:uncharacterized protein LOC124110294 n=1 Tax=Haliotis rufescens TaxID=6454 RepID=UPI00201FAC51|nr:uncharacterized protein LOC124110294 [Haliotis rufescens]
MDMTNPVYKIIVLHDNPKWFPLVKEALKDYDVITDQWLADEVDIDLTSSPPKNTIFYNRCSPSSHTRGHPLSLEQARVIIKWLRHHDVVVVNSLPAIDIEDSKAFQYLMAKDCGLKIPQTVFTSKPTKALIEKHFGTDAPFLIKPDRGGHGINIQLYHNVAEFESEKELPGSYTGLYLIQSYLTPTSGVYRAEFVGQQFLYVSKATMCDGFSSNYCPDDLPKDRFQILKELDDPVIDKCTKLFQTPGLDNGAVEFIYGPDGVPYVIDVNCNTVYNTKVEIEAGVPQGWKKVAETLFAKILYLKDAK